MNITVRRGYEMKNNTLRIAKLLSGPRIRKTRAAKLVMTIMNMHEDARIEKMMKNSGLL